jgi:hypothetical protein
LEGSIGSTFLVGEEGHGLSRLNSALNQLLSTIDSADAAPTRQASLMFDQVRDVLGQQLAKWNLIKESELAALNKKLRAANLPPLAVSEPDR